MKRKHLDCNNWNLGVQLNSLLVTTCRTTCRSSGVGGRDKTSGKMDGGILKPAEARFRLSKFNLDPCPVEEPLPPACSSEDISVATAKIHDLLARGNDQKVAACACPKLCGNKRDCSQWQRFHWFQFFAVLHCILKERWSSRARGEFAGSGQRWGKEDESAVHIRHLMQVFWKILGNKLFFQWLCKCKLSDVNPPQGISHSADTVLKHFQLIHLYFKKESLGYGGTCKCGLWEI